jgi:hypothetical protein
MRLIGFAIYLGIGAMLHAAVIGSTFDWSSAWTFAWLFAWPIMLAITFLWVGVLIAISAAGAIYFARMALERRRAPRMGPPP